MAPTRVVYTLSRMNRTPLDVRRSVLFYAPLRHNLEYIGVEPITFSRYAQAVVRWRDGYYRTVGVDVARFEYDEVGANELGLLWEPERTNNCLRSEEFNDSVWSKTNITVTPNDNGTYDPKRGFTADLLTASGNNGTVIQSITWPNNWPQGFSIFLKRKTGTGDVQITVDGGSTWTTVSISNTAWTRVQKVQALTNPQVGIRIVTQDDEVWAWGAQLEPGVTAISSYIPTTANPATRYGDIFGYPITNPIADPTKTFIWVENGASKVNHLDGSPFSSTTGLWSGIIPVYLREMVGFNRVLSNAEIAIVRSELTGGVVVPVSPPIPVPTPTVIPFSQAVSGGSLSVAINHNIGNAGHHIYAQPNWLTNIAFSIKGANSTTLIFNVQAPPGGGVVEGTVEL